MLIIDHLVDIVESFLRASSSTSRRGSTLVPSAAAGDGTMSALTDGSIGKSEATLVNYGQETTLIPSPKPVNLGELYELLLSYQCTISLPVILACR
jgi:hypothetical protein